MSERERRPATRGAEVVRYRTVGLSGEIVRLNAVPSLAGGGDGGWGASGAARGRTPRGQLPRCQDRVSRGGAITKHIPCGESATVRVQRAAPSSPRLVGATRTRGRTVSRFELPCAIMVAAAAPARRVPSVTERNRTLLTGPAGLGPHQKLCARGDATRPAEPRRPPRIERWLTIAAAARPPPPSTRSGARGTGRAEAARDARVTRQLATAAVPSRVRAPRAPGLAPSRRHGEPALPLGIRHRPLVCLCVWRWCGAARRAGEDR